MRTKQRRLGVDKLFVLGAGASFSATRPNARYISEFPPYKQTPLDKHFTKVLSKLNDGKSTWVNESVKALKKSWRDHIDFSSLGLEEAILTQAANMKFVNAIRPRRGRYSIEFNEYMNHLVHIIAFYLRRSRQGAAGLYNEFVENFFADNETHNRIITFNYDDVLDAVLSEVIPFKDIYFSELKPSQNREIEQGGSDFPMLLKLHGSVNWNCLSDDFSKFITQDWNGQDPFFVENVWFRKKGCPRPNDNISPCIIPPIEAKPITSISLFRFLWTKACEYLHECKELYVCGYSLPPTDALAASLFKEFNNYGLETVTIIDPDPSIMSKWRKLLSRRNVGNARWVYFADFAEFINSLR